MATWSKQSKNSSSFSKQTKNSASWTKEQPSQLPGKFDIARFGKAKFDTSTGTFWTKQLKN